MMDANFGNCWRIAQNVGLNQDQASCYTGYTGYNIIPGQSNYYTETSQHIEQWQQQQFQLNLPILSQELSQQNGKLVYNEYHVPIELTTTINRKSRPKVSETVKRQRQLRRNERERERQARLNSAFDVLRGSIPSFLAPYKEEQKLTQIETLRLAKYYIRSLKGMLEECEKEDNVSTTDQNAKGNAKLRNKSCSGSDASSC